jgi:nitric oxide reductase activation protein
LDTNKLAEAYQGVPQVYTRMGHVRTNNTAVCILIDESGSMSSGFAGTCRCRIARKAGILFNEAFGSVPGVDLFIYGHSADKIESGTTELRIYREPGMKIDQYKALSDVSARFENRDGDAILSAAKRVRKFTQSSCTMFVISDGSPCAIDYWGDNAILDTRKKIVKVQTTLNMNIIGICIDAEVPGDQLYDTHVDLLNLSTLPKVLGQMIKKTIMENRSTVIS